MSAPWIRDLSKLAAPTSDQAAAVSRRRVYGAVAALGFGTAAVLTVVEPNRHGAAGAVTIGTALALVLASSAHTVFVGRAIRTRHAESGSVPPAPFYTSLWLLMLDQDDYPDVYWDWVCARTLQRLVIGGVLAVLFASVIAHLRFA